MRLVQTGRMQESHEFAASLLAVSFRRTMTIYINLLSNFRISFDLKGNNSAVSALSDGAAEVDSAGQEGDVRKLDLRRISESPSNLTLVGEDQLQYPQWIAGVGDLAGVDAVINEAQWPMSRYESSKSYSMMLGQHRLKPHELAESKNGMGIKISRSNTRTALQRHCDFWDTDGDGLIYPWDIYRGFRRLGFHFTLCLWAAVTMAICASYNTQTSYIPHPLFAINLNNINSNRHGSSTGTYDMDGELDERRFESIFQKYAQGKDYLTMWSTYNVWRNQRCGLDVFGWFAGGLECKPPKECTQKAYPLTT